MTITLQKWGNSQGIRIPKHMLDELHWPESTPLDMRIDKNRIIIEPAQKRQTIQELFAGYEGSYDTETSDCVDPMGDVVW